VFPERQRRLRHPALEPTVALVADVAEFNALYDQHPIFDRLGRKLSTWWQEQNRTLTFQKQDAMERYQSFAQQNRICSASAANSYRILFGHHRGVSFENPTAIGYAPAVTSARTPRGTQHAHRPDASLCEAGFCRSI